MRDRIWGCVFEAAIGDAMGVATETMNVHKAQFYYGTNVARGAALSEATNETPPVLEFDMFLRDRHHFYEVGNE